MADPFNMLEADHRQVEQLLSELSESEPGPERDDLVRQLTEALLLHMDFEESSVYPIVRRVDDEESVVEAENEHQLARDGLVQLLELSAQPGFGAAVEMVEAGIGHHVEEEESDMFPELREKVGEAQQADLARQLVEAKRGAGLLEASLESASKDALLEMADALGLEATSSMTKDELRGLVSG